MEFQEVEKIISFAVRTNTQMESAMPEWATPIYSDLYDLTVLFKNGEIPLAIAKECKEGLEKRYNQGVNLIAIVSDIGEKTAKLEVMQMPTDSYIFEVEIKALIDLVGELAKLGYKDCAVAIIEDVERKYKEKMNKVPLHQNESPLMNGFLRSSRR